MTKILTKEITDCDSCPYYDGDMEICTEGDREIPFLPEDVGLPEWCPLPNKKEKGETK